MRSFLQVPNALDVVYEDDAVLLMNKPKGLRAHSDTSEVQDNLADRLLIRIVFIDNEFFHTHSSPFMISIHSKSLIDAAGFQNRSYAVSPRRQHFSMNCYLFPVYYTVLALHNHRKTTKITVQK